MKACFQNPKLSEDHWHQSLDNIHHQDLGNCLHVTGTWKGEKHHKGGKAKSKAKVTYTCWCQLDKKVPAKTLFQPSIVLHEERSCIGLSLIPCQVSLGPSKSWQTSPLDQLACFLQWCKIVRFGQKHNNKLRAKSNLPMFSILSTGHFMGVPNDGMKKK